MHFRNAFLSSVCFSVAIGSTTSAASLTRTALPDIRIPVDTSGQPVSRWSAGALVVVQGNGTYGPVLGVVDKSGVQRQTFAVTVPGAQTVWLSAFSHGAEGTVAAAGEAFDAQGRGGPFIMIFPGSGNATHLIRTGQYFARGVVVAPDGTVWTSGNEAPDKRPPGNNDPWAAFAPYMNSSVIRHFDTQGTLLGSFMPQSGLSTPEDPSLGGTFLAANEDRVVWYCAASKRYLEFSPAGIVLDLQGIEPPVDRRRTVGFALTKSGRVFLSGRNGTTLSELNKATKTWAPVAIDSSFKGIYGADGDTLVIWGGGERYAAQFMALLQ